MANNNYLFVISKYFMSIYLGLSCIYWLPYLDTFLLENIKAFILAVSLISFWIFILGNKLDRLPANHFNLTTYFLLIIFACPGFIQSELFIGLKKFFDISIGFLFIYTFYLFEKQDNSGFKILLSSFRIFSFFIFIHVFICFTGIINLSPPSIHGFLDFSEVGFNFSRTGWSNSVALFFCFFFFYVHNKKNTYFLIIICLFSQYLSGGRLGLLSSIIILLLYTANSSGKGRNLFFIMMFSPFIVYFLDFIIIHLRIDRLLGNNLDFYSLNYFTANRLHGDWLGILKILENPFLGHGFKNVNLLNDISFRGEIHNVWIKLGTESGVLLPSIFLYKCIKILYDYYKNLNDNSTVVLYLIIVCGVIQSMFEPNVLIGSFQNSAIWWATLGVLLVRKTKKI